MTSSEETTKKDPYLFIAQTIREDGVSRYGSTGYSRIVFTNGCFDLIHPGHLKLLNECRKLAGPKGAVVVGVNSDVSVKKIKGPNRPFIHEQSRCLLLSNLKAVDYVVTFDEETPIKLIEALVPDLIVKGSDYKGKEIVGSSCSPVVLIPIEEGISSTDIAERIRKNV